MNEFLASIFSFVTESGVDFGTLGTILLGYIALLWIAFCIWVFVDARKRYDNLIFAILITIFVFVGNFPALILYMVIRPEDEYEHHGAFGGVEVPIMRFVGEDGKVQMSLNLSVNSSLVEKADMALDLGVSTDREDIKLVEADMKPKNQKSFSAPKFNVGAVMDRFKSLRPAEQSKVAKKSDKKTDKVQVSDVKIEDEAVDIEE